MRTNLGMISKLTYSIWKGQFLHYCLDVMLYTHKGVFLNLKSLVIKKLSSRQVAQDHEENYETFYELDLGNYVNKL